MFNREDQNLSIPDLSRLIRFGNALDHKSDIPVGNDQREINFWNEFDTANLLGVSPEEETSFGVSEASLAASSQNPETGIGGETIFMKILFCDIDLGGPDQRNDFFHALLRLQAVYQKK